MPATWGGPGAHWPITASQSAGRNASNSIPISSAPINGARWPRNREKSEDAVKVAVLVPCYNEEAAIAKVVEDFRAVLPDAMIYVYDNNSKDQTVARARAAGAVVRGEIRQ